MSAISVRFLSARKSNLISPISSTPFIEYCVIEMRVLVALLVDVERHHIGERHVGNDDAGGMPRGVAQQPFELERVVEQLGICLALSLSRGSISSASLEREIAALLGRGIELDDLVGLGERQPEHAADVANRLLTLDGPERDDLRDALVAVLLAHVGRALRRGARSRNRRRYRASTCGPGFSQRSNSSLCSIGSTSVILERVGDQAADDRAAARADRNPDDCARS